jgi:hypothetical protein
MRSAAGAALGFRGTAGGFPAAARFGRVARFGTAVGLGAAVRLGTTVRFRDASFGAPSFRELVFRAPTLDVGARFPTAVVS